MQRNTRKRWMRRKADQHARRLRVSFAVLLSLFLVSTSVEASKPLPAVTANFSVGSSVAQIGEQVDVVLHLIALTTTPQVEVEFFIPPQIRVVHGGQPWFGKLAQNETLEFPLTIQIIEEGEYSIGAAVKAGEATAGATVNVIATTEGVDISTDPIFLMKLRRAQTPSERQRLLDRAPDLPSPSAPLRPLTPAEEQLNQYFLDQFQRQGSGQARPLRGTQTPQPSVTTTVSGTLTYQDDTGAVHSIRYALVQILDGATDTLLAETLTLADGTYSAVVTAASVKVRVFSEDGLRSVARVNPLGAPTQRYAYTSATTPVTGPTTPISFMTDRPIRGTPGHPSNDVIQARAFIVLDALLEYQVQAFGLRGGFMPQTKANFPNGASSPCPTISCYQNGEMYILREDALDWDVIGHEFFHYVTDRGSARPIDNNPGGDHDGHSAIGQRPCPTCPPRNRDEGMRLAWSEGLATLMSVRLQVEPASTAFGMSWPSIPNVGDTHYQDTEDAALNIDLETPSPSEGYGSENSITGMFWDFTDTPSDGDPTPGPGNPTDKFDLAPNDIWNLINSSLPCNPCDRVDRFWTAVFNTFIGNLPLLRDVAETPALNIVAPKLLEPAHGEFVSGGVSPTFKWQPNGDPQAAHQPNRFFLAISKDGFRGDVHLFPTDGQPIQASQYQIPDADYRALVEGATETTDFTWVVLAFRAADTDIRIPEGSLYFVSNSRTFKVRAFHIRLTWTTLGTDVDLHFRPPDGDTFVGWHYTNDCAYYNRTPDWGIPGDHSDDPALDRDCITTCTEENISISKVTTPGPYKVLAHYYSAHGLGPTTATVEVFQNGTTIFHDSRVLNNPGTPDQGDLWTVLRIVVSAHGEIEVFDEDEVITPGPGPWGPWWNLPDYLKK